MECVDDPSLSLKGAVWVMYQCAEDVLYTGMCVRGRGILAELIGDVVSSRLPLQVT